MYVCAVVLLLYPGPPLTLTTPYIYIAATYVPGLGRTRVWRPTGMFPRKVLVFIRPRIPHIIHTCQYVHMIEARFLQGRPVYRGHEPCAGASPRPV